MEARQEDVTEEGINYVAMRQLFAREAREAMEVRVEKKTRTVQIRESAERVELSRTVLLKIIIIIILLLHNNQLPSNSPVNNYSLVSPILILPRSMSGQSSVRK